MLRIPVHLILVCSSLFGCRTDKDVLDEPDEVLPEVTDADGDGYGEADDCNDLDASIFPDATEICDGIDNDCDDDIDEGVLETWYADSDDDGFGDPLNTTEACDPGSWVATGNDCDDEDAGLSGASERCDEADNDCDGDIDEDVQLIWFADADGDGFGDAGAAFEICDPPSGYVDDDTDCNDLSADAYPGAEEVCDEIDNDCDNDIDEDVELIWYTDADSDGHGDVDSPVSACEPPEGTVASRDDCDDTQSTISPDATELCDDVDNDCDGDIDEDDAADVTTWYSDSDGDGFGDPTQTSTAATPPVATSTMTTIVPMPMPPFIPMPPKSATTSTTTAMATSMTTIPASAERPLGTSMPTATDMAPTHTPDKPATNPPDMSPTIPTATIPRPLLIPAKAKSVMNWTTTATGRAM